MTSSSREPALANNRAGEYRMIDTQIPPEPLPCPFCGGEASGAGRIVYSRPLTDTWWDDGSEVTESFHVNCVKCGITNSGMVGHRTRNDAIAAWNTRTPKSPSTVEGEKADLDDLLSRFGLVLTDDPQMDHDEQSFGQARDAFVAALRSTPPVNRDDAEARADAVAKALQPLRALQGRPSAFDIGDAVKRVLAALSASPSQPVDRANDEQRAEVSFADFERAAMARFAAGTALPGDEVAFASPVDGGEVERAFREGFNLGDFAGGGQADPRTIDLAWHNSRARAALASQGDRT